MSEPMTFPLFSLFPKEIRLEIWAHTLQPRVITFEYQLYNFNPQNAPQILYLVGGDQPYSHFEIDVPQRPTSPYYLRQAYPPKLGASPSLLSTCHESRDLALKCGYRHWKIQNVVFGTRHVMWNPKYDTISLQMSLLVDDSCFDVFAQQFPEQVREIERVAIDTGRFLPSLDFDIVSKILPFSKLLELAIIINPDLAVEWQRLGDLTGTEIYFKEAKKNLLEKVTPGSEEHMALELWCPPRIRLVGSEDEIFEWILRES